MSQEDDKPDEAAAPVPEPKAEAGAPAVHSDQVWGGPRFIHNATGEPVWVETQEEYWALLNREGLRMMDQQESTTGPEQLKTPEPTPVHQLPAPPVAPMSMDEAHIYGAITAVFQRYGIIETVWCDHCFVRNLHHGCEVRVSSREVVIRCRCGVARYKAPTGTTDMVLKRVTTASITQNDRTAGSIMTPAGPEFRPTVLLHDMEAILIKRYVTALRTRGKEPRLFHKACWSGRPQDEDEALAMSVTPQQIILICKCYMLFHAERGVVQ
jgi:hypothetical protein